MSRIFSVAGFCVASLAALVSTAALADPDAQQDPRDARIQQLQAEVEQLAAKTGELEAQIAALRQAQPAPPVQTLPAEPAPAPAAEAKAPAPAPAAEAGALTWRGITLSGAYDIGLGWVSHGLPENGVNYEGESLVMRNGRRSQFLIAPNNLSQTGLGLRGFEAFAPGWAAVFDASTGINPQSGQLANMAGTNTLNNGLPRAAYSYTGDGARAGQIINDELYVGLASTRYGTLTAGRQRSLGTDAVLAYDPAGGAYDFSFIGYNGLTAGGGDTQDTRWDDALKYKVAVGPLRFGAMYKFADGQGGCYSASTTWTAASCKPVSPHNTAYGLDVGGVYRTFSTDLVVQHVNQAISVVDPLLGAQSPTQPFEATTDSINTNPVAGPNLIGTTNTEYGIVTDNTAVMAAAKYRWNRVGLFAGYEWIRYLNPANPLGVGATAQGGYLLSGVEDDNLDSPKIVQVYWTGVKYAFDARTNLTLSYYHEGQNDFRTPSACSPAAGFRSSCAGQLNEVSLYADYRLARHFDVFSGVTYSDVSGGLAIAIPHGPGVPYYADDNIAPVVGGRFAF